LNKTRIAQIYTNIVDSATRQLDDGYKDNALAMGRPVPEPLSM